MSKKAWIIFAVVVVGLLVGLVLYARSATPTINVGAVDAHKVQAASVESGNIADNVFGTEGKVLLIEYGDFQCPGCAGAHPQIKAISEEYKDRIAFVFRNFPLTTIHANARVAAAAVEAAGLQGKYWDMHNLVFENQSQWKDLTGSARSDQFVDYALQLGLDQTKFTADLAASTVNQKISFDQALGKKVGVSSTPTFYLNGEKLPEEVVGNIIQSDGDLLRDLIDSKL